MSCNHGESDLIINNLDNYKRISGKGSYGFVNSIDDTIIPLGKYTFLNPIDEEGMILASIENKYGYGLLYTSPSPRDATLSRMPSSA